MPKRILMIAGPNGAGKTTIASRLIPDLPMLYEFINADEIARGLAPLHPESVALTASKLMLKRLRELFEADKSFAFETTAARTNYIKYLKDAKSRGYQLGLMFLWVSSPEQAIKRVRNRVIHGGHHVPEETIRRRYYAGLKNLLRCYLPLADFALILDNSMEDLTRIIASKNVEYPLEVENKATWAKLERTAAHG
ncbi:MAG TPA: AAA family ATPase [Rhabdochlamydiaceae bacterium]|jgi:predicted ABC-type ATPase|nr:AAA family ATPase [Rhabdochlamydiaceae bacterium]